MKKKVLLFGSQGMLGMQFLYDYENKYDIIPYSRFHLDLTETESILPEILEINPDVVVNAAAWTDVEKAENEFFQKDVLLLNVDAPREMAKACKELAIPLFHISTDFVFHGNTKEKVFHETSEKNPMCMYGKTKSEGEDLVLSECPFAYIIRTAWLYGEFGPNFVSRMKHLGKKKKDVHVVSDQFGNPTWTKYVAASISEIIENTEEKYSPGIYHAVSSVDSSPPSWYTFAVKIFDFLHITNPVLPIPTEDFPTKAKRPPSSVLQNTKLPPLPSWKTMLKEYLEKK